MIMNKILKYRKPDKTFEIIMHVGFGGVLLLVPQLRIELEANNNRSYKDLFSEFGSILDEIASS